MTRSTYRWLSAASLAASLCALPLGSALAQNKGEIRIAHVHSLTGPLEAYGKQTTTGLMLGLDYATGGTMMVAGKKLVVIEKDDQGKPDLGKSLLAAAYADDKADIAIGPTSSGVALAMLPVAEEYKKILLVEPAVADSDHRREVEQVHLPHRPQPAARTRSATRWRWTSPASSSPRWRRTTPSAATAWPPSRRR